MEAFYCAPKVAKSIKESLFGRQNTRKKGRRFCKGSGPEMRTEGPTKESNEPLAQWDIYGTSDLMLQAAGERQVARRAESEALIESLAPRAAHARDNKKQVYRVRHNEGYAFYTRQSGVGVIWRAYCDYTFSQQKCILFDSREPAENNEVTRTGKTLAQLNWDFARVASQRIIEDRYAVRLAESLLGAYDELRKRGWGNLRAKNGHSFKSVIISNPLRLEARSLCERSRECVI